MMNKLKYVLPTCGVLCLASFAYGGNPETGQAIRLSIELTEGSRLIGTTTEAPLHLITSFGKIALPPDQIRSIRFNENRETVAIQLLNNDQVSGVLNLRFLDVQTLFGKVEVPLAECRSITFMPGKADSGLVLHYTFDDDNEKVRDQSGRGNDGYWVGTPVYEAGVKGKAARFRSKDTYLVASAPELNMNGWNEMTVSLWVSVTGHTLYGHVINRGPLSTDKPGAFELAIGHGYGKGVFAVQNSPTKPCPTVAAVPGNLPLNRWCHLVGTYDGEMLRYYVDGKLEKETRLSASHAPILDGPDTKLVIGNMSRLPFINWSDMFINGLVDEVKIYNRALREEEIKQMYELRK
ncbi:MAG: LamG domain-containing protein [Planctomycetota bacterium]